MISHTSLKRIAQSKFLETQIKFIYKRNEIQEQNCDLIAGGTEPFTSEAVFLFDGVPDPSIAQQTADTNGMIRLYSAALEGHLPSTVSSSNEVIDSLSNQT